MPDADEVLSRRAPPPDHVLRYGPLTDQLVDLRLPDLTVAAPLVVVVHGGFWRAAYDRGHAGPQSAGLAAAGYVVATPEFRRVGAPGGGWPGTLDDVALLTDTVPALVRAAVGSRVDVDRTVLVGHSAGGHLAVWAAARHRLPPGCPWRRSALPVSGVVSLAGVLDLVEGERLGLGGDAVRDLLGGRVARRSARCALADPAGLLPTGVRTALVHGGRDGEVPVAISRSYAAAAGAAGDDCVLHELADVGHYELIDPLSAAWPTVLAAIESLAR